MWSESFMASGWVVVSFDCTLIQISLKSSSFICYISIHREACEPMRIIAFDRFRPGVTMETIVPYLPEEVSNVWRLWKAGIVRENYARADEPGVVIIFELPTVEAAKAYTDDFPLSKAGLLEWEFIALQIPLPIETLFRSEIDITPPLDRTSRIEEAGRHA